MNRLLTMLALLWSSAALAVETIPPAPRYHFYDSVNVVSPEVADKLDQELTQLEQNTSNQVRVAIYPAMESDAPIGDYTHRVAQAWGDGPAGKNNGAVLFIFIQDRKMYLQVGPGLAGPLPDALCKQIVDREIGPRFRRQDYDGGVRRGVDAILGAIEGKYKSKGPALADLVWRNDNVGLTLAIVCTLLATLIVGFGLYRLHRRGVIFGSWGCCCRYYHPYWGYRPYGWAGGSGASSNQGGSPASAGQAPSSSGDGNFTGGGAGGSW